MCLKLENNVLFLITMLLELEFTLRKSDVHKFV